MTSSRFTPWRIALIGPVRIVRENDLAHSCGEVLQFLSKSAAQDEADRWNDAQGHLTDRLWLPIHVDELVEGQGDA